MSSVSILVRHVLKPNSGRNQHACRAAWSWGCKGDTAVGGTSALVSERQPWLLHLTSWDLRPQTCTSILHQSEQHSQCRPAPKGVKGEGFRETDHSVESGCGETGGFGGKGIHMFFQRITSNVNYLYMREMALEFGQITKSKNREGEGERGEEYR